MNKKHFLALVSFVLIALLLVACGGEAQVETVTVEVTRIVEVPAAAPADAAAPAAPAAEGITLQTVRERGTVKCGGNQAVPGFGYINPDTNEFEGFDIDFC